MNTKTCRKCGEDKSYSEFHKNMTTKDGLQGWCKVCLKKKVYEGQKNPTSYKARQLKENREYLWAYLKETPCTKCGLLDPRVMEFDHIDQTTKTNDISYLVYRVSLESLKDEVTKCRVLCANCHKIRTAEQLGYWWTKLDD